MLLLCSQVGTKWKECFYLDVHYNNEKINTLVLEIVKVDQFSHFI